METTEELKGFHVYFNLENAAFDRGREQEIAETLRSIANCVGVFALSGKIMDSNGNHIGEWKFTG